MKKIISLVFILLCVLGVGLSVSAQNDDLRVGNERVKVFVHFENAPSGLEHGIVHAAGGKVTHSYSLIDVVAAEMPVKAIEGLKRNPHVKLIEEDHQVEAVAITYDEEYSNAWGVERIESGYAHETGNKGAGAKVGIIDSGVNYDHPDLASNYNGGYDFYYYDNDPMDVYGHGTHVAGTVCAVDNDNGSSEPKLGVVGVAPECDLYSLRVLNDNGVGYESDIVAAIEWALGREVYLPEWSGALATTTQVIRLDVVNLSLGSDGAYSTASEEVFAAAANEGLVIVAAAGNSGTRPGKGINTIYPAKYESVIAVAATDATDERATFSSTGPEVELAAPGVSVYSTWNDSTGYYDPQPECRDGNVDDCYKYGSGTSMAAPHVAGVAALLISSGLVTDFNGNGIGDEVRQIMQNTAIDLGRSGRDELYGFGLVSVRQALESVVPVATGVLDGYVTDITSNPINEATITAGLYSAVTDISGYYFIENIETGEYTVTVSVSGYGTESVGEILIEENITTSVNFELEEATVADIILSVTGYRVKGVQYADLTWESDGVGQMDVYRDNVLVAETTNDDGQYTDNIEKKGGGSYIYHICDAGGTDNCSNFVTTSF